MNMVLEVRIYCACLAARVFAHTYCDIKHSSRTIAREHTRQCSNLGKMFAPHVRCFVELHPGEIFRNFR